ncbi:MAG: type I restriction enzyme HsdR N-terminal domain-containing protein [Bacteroidia bacterium]|nr:type I restriction enzyme HsdR N-terminal domain-containing protein [Bacteroidia bacterium]
MEKLNLPEYSFKIKQEDNRYLIFDEIRKKFVALTPEEWVRQNIVQFLIQGKNFPRSLIAVETSITVNQLEKRCDAVLFNNSAKPVMIVECKAPTVKLSQETFNQIATYNIKLRVDYLLVTNGKSHYCCRMDYENNSYSFLKEIPSYEEVV